MSHGVLGSLSLQLEHHQYLCGTLVPKPPDHGCNFTNFYATAWTNGIICSWAWSLKHIQTQVTPLSINQQVRETSVMASADFRLYRSLGWIKLEPSLFHLVNSDTRIRRLASPYKHLHLIYLIVRSTIASSILWNFKMISFHLLQNPRSSARSSGRFVTRRRQWSSDILKWKDWSAKFEHCNNFQPSGQAPQIWGALRACTFHSLPFGRTFVLLWWGYPS